MPAIEQALLGQRYEVGKLLGQGSATRVHRAVDCVAGRTVALKIAPADAVPPVHDELRREFRILRELTVPGLPKVFDVGIDAATGESFLALEFIDGQDLNRILRDDEPPSFADLQSTLQRIAEALAALHASGIVHGDLKPANVLLPMTEDGPALARPVLIDFGLAQNLRDAPEEELAGTFAFLAPERYEGDPPSLTADIYAFGVMAYWMAGGSLPIAPRATLEEASRAARDATIEPLPETGADGEAIDATWRDCIMRCLARDPAERPRDGNRLLQALEGQQSGTANPPLPPSPVLGREDLIDRLMPRLLGEATSCCAIVAPEGAGTRRLARELISRLHERKTTRRVIEVVADGGDAGSGEGPLTLAGLLAHVKRAFELEHDAAAGDVVDWLADARDTPSLLVLAVTPTASPEAVPFARQLAASLRLMAPPNVSALLLVTAPASAENETTAAAEPPDWLTADDAVHVEVLEPLADSFADYLASTLRIDVPKLPTPWSDWVQRLQPAWPGLWRHALETLAEAGAVYYAAGKWRLAEERDLGDLPVPQLVNRLAARLDATTDDELLVLAMSLVAGPHATRRRATAALEAAGLGSASDAVDRLALLRLISETREGSDNDGDGAGDPRWRITPRVPDALAPVLDRLIERDDAQHAYQSAIVDALVECDGLPAAGAVTLATMADTVGRPADVRHRLWMQASAAAEAEGDSGAAIDAFETAHALSDNPDELDTATLAHHWRLTHALKKTARANELADRLAAMEPLLRARETELPVQLVQWLEMRGAEASRACDWDTGDACAREALERIARLEQTDAVRRLHVQLLIGLAMIELGRADWGAVSRVADEAEAALDALGADDVVDSRGRVLSIRGHVAWVNGDYAAAREYYSRAAEVEGAAGKLRGQAISLANTALMSQSLGEMEMAEQIYARAEDLYRRLGMIDGLAQLLNSRAHLAQGRGAVVAARKILEEALTLARGRGDVQTEVSLACNIAGEEIEASQLDAAAERLAEARRMVSSVSEPLIQGVVPDNEAELALADGRYDDAVALFEESVNQFRAGGLGWMVERGEARRAATLAFLGNASAAEDGLRRYTPPPPGDRGSYTTFGDVSLWDPLARGLVAVARGAIGLADFHLQTAIERVKDPNRVVERRALVPVVARYRLLQGEVDLTRELCAALRQLEGVDESPLVGARLDLLSAEACWQAAEVARAKSLLRAAHRAIRTFDDCDHGQAIRSHCFAVARLLGEDGLADGLAALTPAPVITLLDWMTLLLARLNRALDPDEDLAALDPVPPLAIFDESREESSRPPQPELIRLLSPLATDRLDELPERWLAGLVGWAVNAPWPGLAWRLAGVIGRITGNPMYHEEARQTLDEAAIQLPARLRPAFWQVPAHLAAIGEFGLMEAIGDGGSASAVDLAAVVDDLEIAGMPTERPATDRPDGTTRADRPEFSGAVGDLATERQLLRPPDPAALANMPTERPGTDRTGTGRQMSAEELAIAPTARPATDRTGDDSADASASDSATPTVPAAPSPDEALLDGGLDEAVTRYQRLLIATILERTGNNRSETARILGIERSRLYRLLKRLGLS